ncbi:MAG: hypothetical protein HY980_01965 [Candidatus Magasanikbacteria bacterium]|nr:hypothetical protein [Candidatus Magasanikbacteria bacterium]
MKTHFSFFLFILITGLWVAWVGAADAKEWSADTFPVAELNNCASQEACHAFCDKNANIPQCVDFALQNDLVSEEDAEWAKKLGGVKEGPGGCATQSACLTYCDDVNHLAQCLDFAAENNLMSPADLEEAKLVAKATAQGVKTPGGCKTKGACDNYCSQAGNMAECTDFAVKAGLMSQSEYQEAQQVMKALAAGAKIPGNCGTKKACDQYCAQPEHMDECVDFGVKAGFISASEAEEAKRIMPLIAAGKMPGGCKGKGECQTYCEIEEHADECAQFAIEAGFMSPEDAEMYKKTGGKGPGGCKSKEACKAFCDDPANGKTCFEFGLQHDLIPPEDMRKMEEGIGQMKKMIGEVPAEVLSCAEAELGSGFVSQINAGDFSVLMNNNIQSVFEKCFSQFMPQPSEQPGEQGMMGQPGEGMLPPGAMVPGADMQPPGEMMNQPPGGQFMPPGANVPGSQQNQPAEGQGGQPTVWGPGQPGGEPGQAGGPSFPPSEEGVQPTIMEPGQPPVEGQTPNPDLAPQVQGGQPGGNGGNNAEPVVNQPATVE